MITINFLGTGTSQGIPVIGNNHPVCKSKDLKDKRLRSSISLKWDDFHYVIDCGPDFRQQMLRLNPSHLNGVLFTHEHADHTAGLDDIRPFCFNQNTIPIYANKDVLLAFEKRFSYIITPSDKSLGLPSVKTHLIDKSTPFYLENKKVIPIEVLHHKLPILGYRIDNFAYLTDVKTINQIELNKLKELDTLVINSLRIETHPSHLNLEESLELIKKINPKKAYLTHLSHLLGFHSEVEKILPENVFLAFDTLQITSN